MTSFIAEHGAVTMITEGGPARLTESMCERLLDIYSDIEGPAAHRLFNELYSAHLANGGIERASSRRDAA